MRLPRFSNKPLAFTGRNRPVVVLTAKDLSQEEREILAAGAARVFAKDDARVDVSMDQVRAEIASHLRHNS